MGIFLFSASQNAYPKKDKCLPDYLVIVLTVRSNFRYHFEFRRYPLASNRMQ